MLALLLGIGGFALYFLYDLNGYLIECHLLRGAFFAGSALLGGATVLDLVSAWREDAFSGLGDIVLVGMGFLAFVALIYCLFFALPFQETYVSETKNRKVYDGGAYALCRHPGVLCFFAMYLLLGLAAMPTPLLRHGMIFTLLNVAYAWFQDRVTFPKCFSDYKEYRKRVPFMVPTKDSVRLAGQTWRRSTGKEETP